MAGRPPKEDSRDKQYRVRLNDAEDEMLSFCSEETGEAKSEIFRKALKAYYENTKYFKNILKDREGYSKIDYTDDMEYDEYEDYGMDHISLKRAIACPIVAPRIIWILKKTARVLMKKGKWDLK